MGSRRQARECALQMLFQWDVTREDPRPLASTYWEVHETAEEVRDFAERLFLGAVERLEAIDKRIERHARNWRLDRMETIDRNVLRLATSELLSEPDTPPTVVLDEAIEIARRFSTTGSARFINGILDSILQDIEQE